MKYTWYVILFGIAAILLVLSWPTVDQYLTDMDTNWYVSPNAGKAMVETGAVAETGTAEVATGAVVETGAVAETGAVVETGAVAEAGAATGN